MQFAPLEGQLGFDFDVPVRVSPFVFTRGKTGQVRGLCVSVCVPESMDGIFAEKGPIATLYTFAHISVCLHMHLIMLTAV